MTAVQHYTALIKSTVNCSDEVATQYFTVIENYLDPDYSEMEDADYVISILAAKQMIDENLVNLDEDGEEW